MHHNSQYTLYTVHIIKQPVPELLDGRSQLQHCFLIGQNYVMTKWRAFFFFYCSHKKNNSDKNKQLGRQSTSLFGLNLNFCEINLKVSNVNMYQATAKNLRGFALETKKS